MNEQFVDSVNTFIQFNQRIFLANCVYSWYEVGVTAFIISFKKSAKPPVCHYGSNEPKSRFPYYCKWLVNAFNAVAYELKSSCAHS
jgi:hypothetical protein